MRTKLLSSVVWVFLASCGADDPVAAEGLSDTSAEEKNPCPAGTPVLCADGSSAMTEIQYTPGDSADSIDGAPILEEDGGCPFNSEAEGSPCSAPACQMSNRSPECAAVVEKYCASYPDDPGCQFVRGRQGEGEEGDEEFIALCLESKCGVELQACQENSSCAVYLECVPACEEEACRAECRAPLTEDASALSDALFECGVTNACFPGGNSLEEEGNSEEDAADECLIEKCPGERQICMNDSACAALFACAENCGDANVPGESDVCVDECFANASPEALAVMEPLFLCGEEHGCFDVPNAE